MDYGQHISALFSMAVDALFCLSPFYLDNSSRPIHGEHAPLRSSGGNSQIGGENGDEGQRARRFEAFTRPRFASLTETLHLNVRYKLTLLIEVLIVRDSAYCN